MNVFYDLVQLDASKKYIYGFHHPTLHLKLHSTEPCM